MERLVLKDFLSHEHTDLTLGPATLVLGPNGAGKTALVSAIEFVTTGACRDMDGRGFRNAELIRGSEERASVRLFGPNGPYAERTQTRNESTFSLSGSTGTSQQVESEFWAQLGVTGSNNTLRRQIMRLFLRAGDLSSWSDKTWSEAVGMIASGTARDVLADLAKFLGRLSLEPPMVARINGFVTEANKDLWTKIGKVDARDLVVKEFESWFYDRRRLLKQEIKAARARATPAPESQELAALSDAELRTQITGLEAHLQSGEQEVRMNAGKIEAIQATRDARSRLRQAYLDAEERHHDLQDLIKAEPDADLVKRQRASVRDMGKILAESERALAAAQAGDTDLSQAIDLVIRSCESVLSIKSVKALRQTTSETPAMSEDEALKLLADDKKRMADYEAGLREMEEAQTRAKDAKVEIEQVEQQLREFEGQDNSDPEDDPDLHEAALEKWTGEVDEARAKIEPLKRESGRREYARRADEGASAGLIEDVGALDTLVKAMRDGEVKTGSAGDLVASILTEVNENVKALVGGEVALSPSGQFRYRSEGGERAWDLLSDSEKMRFGLALAAGLSRAFSFPWLIVDGVELIVGQENRKALFAWLDGQRKHFQKVLVLGASKPLDPKKNPVPLKDWTAYWVEDGKMEALP